MSGAVMFMIMRMVDVLPAPFGPSRPKMLPAGTRHRDAVHRHEVAVGLADVPQFENGCHVSVSFSGCIPSYASGAARF